MLLLTHLGNVLAAVSDVKKAVSTDGSTIDHYEASITSNLIKASPDFSGLCYFKRLCSLCLAKKASMKVKRCEL